jgi:cytochrome c556
MLPLGFNVSKTMLGFLIVKTSIKIGSSPLTAAVLVIGLGLAGTAWALTPQEQADARQANMKEMGKSMKIIGGAAKSGTIGDDVPAAAAKVVELSKVLGTWFPKGTGDGDPGITKSNALAGIWTSPDDFAVKVKALADAAPGLIPAAASKDIDKFRAAVEPVGASCKGCHKAFEKPDK